MQDYMRRRAYHIADNNRQGGFSLIELAIVMVIISLLLLPLIRYYDLYRMQKAMGDTRDRQIELSTAVNEFYAREHRYPCPSDRSLAFGTNGHGREVCAPAAALGANVCSGGQGYCHLGTGAQRAFIGGVPYATLDIPYSKTLDGWKRNMTYAVSQDLAIIPPGTEFNPNGGTITVRGFDEAGNPASELYHGLIISSGENGAGSFNAYGARTPCITTLHEGENCNDNNTIFVRSLNNGASLANTNQYYDDMVSTNAWNTSSIWEFDDVNTDNVTAVVPGNLGIGTKTPTEKLEVVGGLKTDKINSLEICDVKGENCFPATTIGGVGIKCPDGQVLTGIAYNQPICKPTPITGVQPKTCPGGQVVTAIQNGVVICGVP